MNTDTDNNNQSEPSPLPVHPCRADLSRRSSTEAEVSAEADPCRADLSAIATATEEAAEEALAKADQPSTCLCPQAPGETARAFEAFRTYLELGPSRRYAAVSKKVGVAMTTVKCWASTFEWRARVKAYAAQHAQQYDAIENTVRREEHLDAAARAKIFRDRQYALAEAILDSAERYIERLDEDDLDVMSFADACRALEVASRLATQAEAAAAQAPSSQDNGLREQLSALLDQVYGEAPTSTPDAPIPAKELKKV